jgi:hypothetical protein
MPRYFSKLDSDDYSLESEIFECIDLLDQLVVFFELLEMCKQELSNPSDKSAFRCLLLMDAFNMQIEPFLRALHCKLRVALDVLR